MYIAIGRSVLCGPLCKAIAGRQDSSGPSPPSTSVSPQHLNDTPPADLERRAKHWRAVSRVAADAQLPLSPQHYDSGSGALWPAVHGAGAAKQTVRSSAPRPQTSSSTARARAKIPDAGSGNVGSRRLRDVLGLATHREVARGRRAESATVFADVVELQVDRLDTGEVESVGGAGRTAECVDL